MKAGRELDALVQQHVLEKQVKHLVGRVWCWLYDGKSKHLYGLPQTIPYYSTDITAAWEVVEKLCNWDVDDNMLVLKGQGPDLEKKEEPDGEAAEWWEAEISGCWGKAVGEADKPAMAICLAALKAKGIDV